MNLRILRLAAIALLLTGCGGGDTPSDAPQLAVARVKDAVVLDPSLATDGLSLNVASEMFQNLVAFRPGTFAIVPQIARSWVSSRDGKSWTFNLEPGLKFSDGTPLDAAAVKFNFDRWRLTSNPYHGKYSYGYYASQFGGFPGVIANVEAPSPSVVKFTLATPFGPFLRDLAMASFGIGSPTAIKADLDGFGRAPVASGPYTLGEWVKDDHITLRANPNWHGLRPAYGTVIVRDIPDQSTSILSIQKGDVDLLTDPRPDDAKELATEPTLKLYQQPSNNVTYLALNVEKKPFDNVLVRRAVNYAIDKAAIARNFYALGATVADNFTPPGMLGDNPAVKAYPHDVAMAKKLLAQAGLPHGFSTVLYYPTAPRPYMPEPQRMAEAIQSDLAAAGITLTLQPLEFGVFLDKVRNGEHAMCLIGWTGDNGDPDNFLYVLLDKDSAVKGSAQNYSFWRDPAYHALMLQGQHTIDEEQRGSIYAKANAMIHDQAPVVALTHSAVSFAAKRSIAGIVPRPDGILNYELMSPVKQ